MQQLGQVLNREAGKDRETRSAQLVPISKPESQQPKAMALTAAKAVDRLFDLLPPQDVGDPKAFMMAAAGIFAKYPDVVVESAISAIPARSDRVTLKLITSVCDELHAPILRDMEREQARQNTLRLLPRPPRTMEEQARIDAQVFNALGRWPESTPRSVIDESEKRFKLFGYVWLDGKWQSNETITN